MVMKINQQAEDRRRFAEGITLCSVIVLQYFKIM